MLKGIRWPLLALVVAVILFVISFATRPTDSEPEDVVVQPTATAPTAIISTETPVPIIAEAPTPIPPAITTGDIMTYREGLVGHVQRLNPLLANLNPVDSDITSLIFEGLTGINEYGEVIPVLAKEWVISSDGLEYVVTLRDDILWQDGIPFNADDVIFTMSMLRSPEFVGSPEFRIFWQTIEIQKIDDYLIRFRLAQPLASFLEVLRIGILPVHALQGTPANELATHPFNLSPIGTGPYQLEALRLNNGQIQQVDLRVAPVFRNRPEGAADYALERVSFHLYATHEEALQALQSGDVDAYATTKRQDLLPLSNMFAQQITEAPVVGTLIFNWVDGRPFNDQRVRQALARGLDKGPLVERHLFNLAIPAHSPFLPQSWAYAYDGVNIVWPNSNPVEAANLLSTVRLTDAEGEEISTLKFSILTTDNPAIINMAQEIAAQWQASVSAEVTIESVSTSEFMARLEAGEFDTAIVELSKEGSADPDVYDFWHQGQYPDGKNYGGANDRTISEALERARRDANGTNRSIHYTTFQREFINRAIAIPLYYPLFTYIMRPQVQGIQFGFIGNASDRFMSIADWSID